MLSKEVIFMAAKRCYYPESDITVNTLKWVIEALVLPEGCDGYTDLEMETYITNKLKEAEDK
jgi:uncharacterized protein YheU (UPF0270 family)